MQAEACGCGCCLHELVLKHTLQNLGAGLPVVLAVVVVTGTVTRMTQQQREQPAPVPAKATPADR